MFENFSDNSITSRNVRSNNRVYIRIKMFTMYIYVISCFLSILFLSYLSVRTFATLTDFLDMQRLFVRVIEKLDR